jgi:hypothetical protein
MPRVFSGRAARMSARGRVVAGVGVLAALTALAVVLAFAVRDTTTSPSSSGSGGSAPRSPSASAVSPSTSASREDHRAGPAVPPRTSDPLSFAKAAAAALWSYDTRSVSQPEHLAGLRRWMTKEKQYADVASVLDQVPDRSLWQQMASQDQYAVGEATGARFPAAFTQALQADPGAITQVYAYAVTVYGRQTIAWKGAEKGGAEPRAVTLAVQCRPDRPCGLVGVLPNVAP